MFRKIFIFSMTLWATIGLFVVLMTSYFENTTRTGELLSNISQKLKSYNVASIHTDRSLSNEAEQLKNSESVLAANKDKLVSYFYTLQSDVSSNQYKTLTALSVRFAERYLKAGYEDSKILLSDMRSIVNTSTLASDRKIKLLKELRDTETSLTDITTNIAEIKELTYKLNSKREELNKKFFADILEKTEKEKLELTKKVELKQLISGMCFAFLILGIIGIIIDMYLTDLKIKKDVNILFSSIEAVHAGAEPEVIERHKTISYLKKLKTQIYEIIKVQSDELNFLKQSINSIETPLMLRMGDRVFKNKAMGDICINLAVIPSNLGDEFLYDNMLYIKSEQSNGVCIIPIQWKKIKSMIDAETSYGIETNNTDKLIPSLHLLYSDLNYAKAEINELKKALDKDRDLLEKTTDMLTETKASLEKKDKLISGNIQRGRILLEDGINMSGSIKVFGIKVSDLYAKLKDLSVFNSRIDDGKSIISEQISGIDTLLSLIKANKHWFEQIENSIKLGNVSGIKQHEIEENIGRMNKTIMTLEQVLISYRKLSAIADEDFLNKLTHAVNTLVESYKSVFNLADRINTDLEDLSKSDLETEVNV